MSEEMQLQLPTVKYSPGDMLWGRVSGHPWWPCMVANGPNSSPHLRTIRRRQNYQTQYHVQYFGEENERGWIGEGSLMIFEGQAAFEKLKEERLSPSLASQYKKDRQSFTIAARRYNAWQTAVSQAEEAFTLSKESRIQKCTYVYPDEPVVEKKEPMKKRRRKSSPDSSRSSVGQMKPQSKRAWPDSYVSVDSQDEEREEHVGDDGDQSDVSNAAVSLARSVVRSGRTIKHTKRFASHLEQLMMKQSHISPRKKAPSKVTPPSSQNPSARAGPSLSNHAVPEHIHVKPESLDSRYNLVTTTKVATATTSTAAAISFTGNFAITTITTLSNTGSSTSVCDAEIKVEPSLDPFFEAQLLQQHQQDEAILMEQQCNYDESQQLQHEEQLQQLQNLQQEQQQQLQQQLELLQQRELEEFQQQQLHQLQQQYSEGQQSHLQEFKLPIRNRRKQPRPTRSPNHIVDVQPIVVSPLVQEIKVEPQEEVEARPSSSASSPAHSIAVNTDVDMKMFDAIFQKAMEGGDWTSDALPRANQNVVEIVSDNSEKSEDEPMEVDACNVVVPVEKARDSSGSCCQEVTPANESTSLVARGGVNEVVVGDGPRNEMTPPVVISAMTSGVACDDNDVTTNNNNNNNNNNDGDDDSGAPALTHETVEENNDAFKSSTDGGDGNDYKNEIDLEINGNLPAADMVQDNGDHANDVAMDTENTSRPLQTDDGVDNDDNDMESEVASGDIEKIPPVDNNNQVTGITAETTTIESETNQETNDGGNKNESVEIPVAEDNNPAIDDEMEIENNGDALNFTAVHENKETRIDNSTYAVANDNSNNNSNNANTTSLDNEIEEVQNGSTTPGSITSSNGNEKDGDDDDIGNGSNIFDTTNLILDKPLLSQSTQGTDTPDSSSYYGVMMRKVSPEKPIENIISSTTIASTDGREDSTNNNIPVKFCHICETPGVEEGVLVECQGPCHGFYHLSCLGLAVLPMRSFRCGQCSTGCHCCFVCKNSSKDAMQCGNPECGKFYHTECLSKCPTKPINSSSSINNVSNCIISSFTCPRHLCATCTIEAGKVTGKSAKGAMYKCIKCPRTYHANHFCLPVSCRIIDSQNIICSSHFEQEDQWKSSVDFSVDWCSVCLEGSNYEGIPDLIQNRLQGRSRRQQQQQQLGARPGECLVTCSGCPMAFHPSCYKISPSTNLWKCKDCVGGRNIFFGDIVWAKLSNYRWWPARVLLPKETNDKNRILPSNQEPGQVAVEFYGINLVFWMPWYRLLAFEDGEHMSKDYTHKYLMNFYEKGIKVANQTHEERTNQRKKELCSDQKSGSKPEPYKHVKISIPMPGVEIVKAPPSENPACNCVPDETGYFCGPDSDCINRLMLYECHPMVCHGQDKCLNQRFSRRQDADVRPRKAQGKGWGLFSRSAIEKGQFIGEYVGDLIDSKECKSRLEEAQINGVSNFYMLTLDKNRIVDAGPKGNYTRFMNHSCEPNCETQKWTVSGDIRVGLFAIKDIPADAESTFNYNLDCFGNEKTKCKCGSSICSGFLGVRPKTAAAVEIERKSLGIKMKKGLQQQNCVKKRGRKSKTVIQEITGIL